MSERIQCAEYIKTATEQAAVTILWQAPDVSDAGNGFPISDGGNEYSEMVLENVPELRKMVAAFVRKNWSTLKMLRMAKDPRHGYDAGQCGHDIILTAGHHGTGFWDRGLGEWGDELTKAAQEEWGYDPFQAEFALNEDGDVDWLMVLNHVLVDERNWST